jgi:tRNA-Thr(GGU) m(6)t(6)A37 methyltransferase TsaA
MTATGRRPEDEGGRAPSGPGGDDVAASGGGSERGSETGVTIGFRPIGVIHSEHTRSEETPVQPTHAAGIPGTVEVFREYEQGLDDLERFSHVYLIYHLDRSGPPRLRVVPFRQDEERGVFATRSPSRPNAIGLSLVRLVGRDGHVLRIEDVDVLDGTPLLDIKPYVPALDSRADARSGRQDDVDEETAGNRGRSADKGGRS